MDRFDAMRVFTRVVERRSFTLAAEDLGLPRSTVTDAVKQLEKRLGVRLLERTTRHVAPTLDGEAYHRRCLTLIADLEDAEAAFGGAKPKGLVRVDANGLLARTFLLPNLPAFLADYPDIEVFLSDGDRLVDLVREGIDCVVRVGEPRDSDMVGRRLAVLEEVTVAAPAYIQRFDMPDSIEALDGDHSGHRMVGFHSSATGTLLPLEFMADGVLRKLTLPATVTANGADNYIAMARLGLGLVQVPRYRVESELTAGTLVAVLPEFPPAPSPVSLLYPRNRQLSPRVRVFIDWLVRVFGTLEADTDLSRDRIVLRETDGTHTDIVVLSGTGRALTDSRASRLIAEHEVSMTLLQLKILRELERQSLNISATAKTLNTSQPGVSRQIQMLERDLGVALLVRKTNRVVAFSSVGRTILAVAKSLLNQAENIDLLAQEAQGGRGKLVVATTHLHARYTLLQPFKALQKKYPHIRMFLFQADPDDIPKLVNEHQADIGLNTSDGEANNPEGVVCLAGDVMRRSAIMLPKHPLAKKKRLAIHDFASHALVGYNPKSRAGSVIARAFEQSGIVPNVIVQANDSDVIKAYVAEGLGIGIVPTAILDRHSDAHLHSIDVTDLFPRSHMNIITRSDMHLRNYVRDFIHMVAPASKHVAAKRQSGKV